MRFSSNQAIHKSSGPPEHASTVPACPRSDDVTGQARMGVPTPHTTHLAWSRRALPLAVVAARSTWSR
jgi:hypothetical protein